MRTIQLVDYRNGRYHRLLTAEGDGSRKWVPYIKVGTNTYKMSWSESDYFLIKHMDRLFTHNVNYHVKILDIEADIIEVEEWIVPRRPRATLSMEQFLCPNQEWVSESHITRIAMENRNGHYIVATTPEFRNTIQSLPPAQREEMLERTVALMNQGYNGDHAQGKKHGSNTAKLPGNTETDFNLEELVAEATNTHNKVTRDL